jgi:small subunit ribosomal protein S25e
LLRHDLAGFATNSRTVKDKANHAVVFDKQTNDKLQKDVQSYRLITVATLVDRLKINGSLARQALADLEANGQIKKVVGHSKLSIYSMSYHGPYATEHVHMA